MTTLNATHLFEYPARHHHNSESWWSAFFSVLVLYEATTAPSFSLPIYTYATDTGYRKVGNLACKDMSFSKLHVEAPLSAKAFGLNALPTGFLGLKPDVVFLDPDRRQATFVETKTIGATIAQNVMLYGQVITYLKQNDWNVDLFYLLSHGHEARHDWLLIEREALRIILWEDVLKAAAATPLARIFDVDLTTYASPPLEPVGHCTT